MVTDLRQRWVLLAMRWGAGQPSATAGFDGLVARYAEEQRRYHTIEHVAAVLTTLDELLVDEPIDHPEAVQFAAWLHDVVYDPTRGDNEAESARHVWRVLSMFRVPMAVTDETARLIELTVGHEVDPTDRDGMVLVDADLAILGAPADTYERYAADIHAEYAHVDDEAFRTGRRRILETFVARPHLFHTAGARARFEDAARVNLRRELDRLG